MSCHPLSSIVDDVHLLSFCSWAVLLSFSLDAMSLLFSLSLFLWSKSSIGKKTAKKREKKTATKTATETIITGLFLSLFPWSLPSLIMMMSSAWFLWFRMKVSVVLFVSFFFTYSYCQSSIYREEFTLDWVSVCVSFFNVVFVSSLFCLRVSRVMLSCDTLLCVWRRCNVSWQTLCHTLLLSLSWHWKCTSPMSVSGWKRKFKSLPGVDDDDTDNDNINNVMFVMTMMSCFCRHRVFSSLLFSSLPCFSLLVVCLSCIWHGNESRVFLEFCLIYCTPLFPDCCCWISLSLSLISRSFSCSSLWCDILIVGNLYHESTVLVMYVESREGQSEEN